MVELKSEFKDRATFSEFLNERGLVGQAVEIGTHRGDFAFVFMDGTEGEPHSEFIEELNGFRIVKDKIITGWKGQMLYCIDPWLENPELPKYNDSTGDREADYQEFLRRLDYHIIPHFELGIPSRVTPVRATSEKAAKSFVGECLDFVYIDGDHRYQSVLQDLNLWWPKLQKGGILAGHDFICPREPKETDWAPQVQRAVSDFCESMKVRTLYLVPEHGLPWSFYMAKP